MVNLIIEEEPLTGVKVLRFPYEGLIYCYQHVQVIEQPELGSATVRFNFRLLNVVGAEKERLDRDPELHTLVGDILVELVTIEKELKGELVPASLHYKELEKTCID